jgi:hypothetical protein
MRLLKLLLCAALCCWLAGCSCREELGQPGDQDGKVADDGPGSEQGLSFDGYASDGKKDWAGGDSFVSGSLPFCQRTCNVTSDCCASPPCNKGRDAISCKAGICTRSGCKTNADCMVAGAQAGTCKQIKDKAHGVSYGLCGDWCGKDADCGSLGNKCVATLLQSGDRVCGAPCTNNAQCLASLVCVGGKFCGKKEQRPCKADADCTGATGLLRCYVPLGRCYCADDKTCTTALGPIKGGVWLCR